MGFFLFFVFHFLFFYLFVKGITSMYSKSSVSFPIASFFSASHYASGSLINKIKHETFGVHVLLHRFP